MLTKGDKIVLVEKMGMFDNIGEICTIIDVSDSGVITFKFGNGMHLGCMSADEFEKYFKKYEEKSVSVDIDFIDHIIEESHINVSTVFDKCTVVACKLPSGFVIVESSACVDPKNYDKDMGVDICLNRIKDRICEMEAYKLQAELWEDKEDCCNMTEECADCEHYHGNGVKCTGCYYDEEYCENCCWNDD